MKRAIRKHLGEFVALAAMMAIALGVLTYVLENQRVRFPFVEEKAFRLQVELADAQAVTAGQGQSVQVAGVKIGDIGKVELEDGHAIVNLELEPRYEGLVTDEAAALLRPRTPLKDMLVEIAPGRGRPLEDGERIPLANTLPDVDLDEVLAALDADTRDYLKLLVTGAGEGLRGRGTDLRRTLAVLGPLHRDVARVTRAVARRRSSLRRLVNRYGRLTQELGRADRDIVRLVRASDATFEAFASRRDDLEAAVAELPGALGATRSALERLETLGGRLPGALEALRPAVRELDPAMRATLPLAREATPILRDRLRPISRLVRSDVPALGDAAGDLAQAGPDLSTGVLRLNRLLDMLAFNPGGAEPPEGSFDEQRSREEGYLYWLAAAFQNGSSAFANADGQGVLRRFNVSGTTCGTLASAGLPAEVADLLGQAGLCSTVVRP